MADSRFNNRQDSPPGEGAANHPLAEVQAATTHQKTQPRPKPKSYLETAVNFVTEKLISDDKTRAEVNHYTCEFAKTATLFAGGKVGIAGTLLVYGAAQASPDSGSKLDQLEDFALGAAKGGAIKGLFGLAGNAKYSATRGVLMGMASRGSDTVFRRETFSNPLGTLGNLGDQLTDKQAWATDAAVFMAGEGLFHAGKPLFGRSQVASGMLMGGSFGGVNGAIGEIGRQREAKEKFDLGKVFERGLLQAGLDATAAGVGIKGTSMAHAADVKMVTSRLKSSINNLHQFAMRDMQLLDLHGRSTDAPEHQAGWPIKEYVITDGKDVLDTFRNNESESALLTVRELMHRTKAFEGDELGPARKLFVQRLRIGEQTLMPGAKDADLVASCFPENLSPEVRAKHVFPEGHGQGRVWIQDGPGDRLRLSAGWHPIAEWRREGFTEPYRLDGGNTTISVMAPLLVGDPRAMEHPASKKAWEEFDRDLTEAKALGIDSVSTDIWWSLVEPKKGEYDWSYYEKIAEHIKNAGLKWTPILSFHACGGNIGDTVNVPLPDWVWADLAPKVNGGVHPDALKFASEQGNKSSEYISYWATEPALQYYADVMKNFQDHFAAYAPYIAEINISLGPAGELRFPSYNSHDEGAGYPTRGALQCYSELARQSFREYVLSAGKYGSIEAVAKAWGINGLTVNRINPPDDATGFFGRNDHMNTVYGRDFIDWYHQSLLNHGNMMMTNALRVFAAQDAAFAGIDLGAKIPGVHWRIGERVGNNIILSDRLAEITAGLIRTSGGDWYRDEDGRGYRDLLGMLHKLQPLQPGTGNPIVPSFTAMEMPDGQDGPAAKSLPRTLAIWVGQEAERQNQQMHGHIEDLTMKAENALSGNLSNPYDWDNIRTLLNLPGQHGYFHGATFLRISDVVRDPVARAKVSEIIHAIRSVQQDIKKAS